MIFILTGIMIFPRFFGISGIWMTVPCAELLTILEESRIKLESMGYKKLGNDILEELKWNES